MKHHGPVEVDDLATELHADITRAELALEFRSVVLAPLHTNTVFQAEYRGAYSHMVVSTLTLVFMTLSRLFDKAKGRHSITLEHLIQRILQMPDRNDRVKKEAEVNLKRIEEIREQLSKLRNGVFAHKNQWGNPGVVSWDELVGVRDSAKEIFQWCGSERGHSYSFSTPLR